jgi:transposase
MDTRLFPVKLEFFNKRIKPLINKGYSPAGRPPNISDYHVFCAMLYVLRTGIPWRDLPTCYGDWNNVYQRFKRSSDRGVWWRVLHKLQQDKRITMNIILADSTTFKVHRHGGGLKGGCKAKECDHKITPCDYSRRAHCGGLPNRWQYI